MTDTSPETLRPCSPLIISEHDHPIRPEMIDRDAVAVLRRLHRSGYSGYLVGGGVRDLYLGRVPKDYDISTDARPGQIRRIFPNSTTIGRRFRLVQVFFPSGKVIEVSTLRSLSEHDLDGPEAVLAPNNTFGTLHDDAQRRDLSINSLFYDLENRTIIDYVGGIEDLDRAIVRMVGDPDKRINRDPVRMMRAIRHSTRTGFTIEEKTWKSICTNHHKLSLCPSSRIRDELYKDLYSGTSRQWFERAIDCELFLSIFPFYRKILFNSPPAKIAYKDQLGTIFNIIDTTNHLAAKGQGKKLPNYFVLALIALPWAEACHQLSKVQLKGPGAFQLSKKLRDDIDDILGIPFNLQRSIRQEIVTLLTNLPHFVRFGRNDTWPKWIEKKSYYANGLLFYEFYKETNALQKNQERMAELVERMVPPPTPQRTPAPPSEKRNSRPSFSSKKKGGIFGLKK